MNAYDVNLVFNGETDAGHYKVDISVLTSNGKTERRSNGKYVISARPTIKEVFSWSLLCDIPNVTKSDRIVMAEYITRRLKEKLL